MFDVDRLKEAVAEATEDVSGQAEVLVSAEPYPTILAAAHLVVAGQPLQLCEPHESVWLNDDDGCEAAYSSQVKHWRIPCRMIEGWWMPTGKDET